MSAVFRQLTAGIKFDKKKYRHEAEKFGLVKKIENENEEKHEEKLPVSLGDPFIPDSNLPTPDDSGEEETDLKLLGMNNYIMYLVQNVRCDERDFLCILQ